MKIPPIALQVSSFAATEATRYALDCVHVARRESGECRAEATNGKSIARILWKADVDERGEFSGEIPCVTAATAKKLAKGNDMLEMAEGKAGIVEVTGPGGVARGLSVDKGFPPTDSVYPRTENAISQLKHIVGQEITLTHGASLRVRLDPGHLGDVCALAKKLYSAQKHLLSNDMKGATIDLYVPFLQAAPILVRMTMPEASMDALVMPVVTEPEGLRIEGGWRAALSR